MPRSRPPTFIVEYTRSLPVSMTVIVPSRSLVTKASGPDGFDVQLASMRANKKTLPQRRHGAASFVAPLRHRVRNPSLKFMLDTVPPSRASTPRHHTTTAGASDPIGPTGPTAHGT